MIDGDKYGRFLSPFIVKTYSGAEVRAIWGSVCVLIQRGIAYSRSELDPCCIRKALLSGHLQLWTFSEDGVIITVMITELRDYAKKRSCNLLLVSSEQSKKIWRALFPYMQNWLLANDRLWQRWSGRSTR